MSGFNAVPLLAALLVAAPMAVPVSAARSGCSDFVWNVHQERALFAGQAQSRAAGTDRDSAPAVQPDQLYDLRLAPQPQVHFAMAPGKTMLTDGAYAGLVRLKVGQAGTYRVSLDVPFWIDVVSHGQLLPTQDFQGQRGCAAPRKIVEFVLPADQDLWLQFSGAPAAQLHVSITRAPPAAG